MADAFRAAPPEATYLQIGMYALNNGEIETFGRTLAFQVLPVRRGGQAQTLDAKFHAGANANADAYELARDGTNWRLTLYWSTDAALDGDYTVFAHLIDASGKILAQVDRQPLDGVYPTSAWQPGQVIRDIYEFPAADGGVKIEFGLYDALTGKRLPRVDGSGDRATLDAK